MLVKAGRRFNALSCSVGDRVLQRDDHFAASKGLESAQAEMLVDQIDAPQASDLRKPSRCRDGGI